MNRSIGLWGAVITLVGFVIGASIFLLPAELAATAGPGVIISYAIASIIAAFSCVIAIQISDAYPISGASFIITSKMLSPFLGFIVSWLIICSAALAIALVAHGFSEYSIQIIPFNKMSTAICVVLLLGFINILGTRASLIIQSVMVIFFISVIVVFSTVGFATLDSSLLTPFNPSGYSEIFIAAVPAFFSYAGFLMIIEIGGEIKKPHITIPLALLISFLTVWLCYSAISLVIVGHIPWQELANTEAALTVIASTLFPKWIIPIITLTILLAAASSINGLILGYSRDIYILSRVRLLPSFFSKRSIHATTNSIFLLTLLSAIAVLIGAKITEYATTIVILMMLAQMLLGISCLRLEYKSPKKQIGSQIKLTVFWRKFFAIGLTLLSLAFSLIGMFSSPISTLISIVIILFGACYYFLRVKHITSTGICTSQKISEYINESQQTD